MAGTSHAQMIGEALRRAGQRVSGRSLPSHVVNSWRRCIDEYGLQPDRVRLPNVLTRAELAQVSAPIEDLIALARPEVERLLLRLRAFGFIVTLAERGAAVVMHRGDGPLPEAFSTARNVLGAVCREDRQGTGGISTCLREARPLVVDRDEHFDARVTDFTCVAAPIAGVAGETAAVLNASCWRRDGHVAPALALDVVGQSARRIANRVFALRHVGRRVVRVSRFDDFADISVEGRFALDSSDHLIDATPEALQLIGGVAAAPVGMRLEDLCGMLDEAASGGPQPRARARGRLFMRMLEDPRTHVARPRSAVPSAASASLCALRGLEPELETQIARARRVIERGVPILILGETGSGKSALARALHEESRDRDAPFTTVNCAALTPDRLASAIGEAVGAGESAAPPAGRGTVFLDQIDGLTPDAQAALLGLPALDAATTGGRIVAAGSHDLQARVRAGGFRDDLYHRIAGLTVNVPALRERADRDLAIERVLRDEALRAGVRRPRIEAAVLQALRRHSWPGNFHELLHVARIAVAVADGGLITLATLPASLHPPAPSAVRVRLDRQRAAIESTLARTGWNVQRAAQLLRISRATLHRRIRTLGLQRQRRHTRATLSTP